MIIQEYLAHMKEVYRKLLHFIENNDNGDNYFQELIKIIKDYKIPENQNYFKSLLHLIINISNNHHRGPNFFDQIFQILRYFHSEITRYFSNTEIFMIFESNKRLLLFLLDEKLMTMDEAIAYKLKNKKYRNAKYPQYFFTELRDFIQSFKKGKPECLPEQENPRYQKKKTQIVFPWVDEMTQKLPENYEEKRRIGENDEYICELIRNDSVTDFIKYVNMTNFPLKGQIKMSIYETNPFFLKKKNLSLIKYVTFYGSVKIFNFLKMSRVKLDSSLWTCMIHSLNPRLLHAFEDNKVDFQSENEDEKYFYLVKESIKCHHNNFCDYILANYWPNPDAYVRKIQKKCLKYYNFEFVHEKQIDNSFFYFYVYYDYISLVEYFLKKGKIDINESYVTKVLYIKFRAYSIQHELKKTLLYVATEKGYIEIVKLLLSFPNIDVNRYSKDFAIDLESNEEYINATALHCAVNYGELEIAKLLLSHKNIDTNKLDMKLTYEDTPLVSAVKNNNLGMVKLLLESDKVDPYFESENSVLYAVNNENAEIVKELVSCKKINVNATKISHKWNLFKKKLMTEETALFLAILRNNLEIIDILLSCKRYNVNMPIRRYNSQRLLQELSILDLAIEKKNLEIIKRLISCERIDINFLSKTFNERQSDNQVNSTESLECNRTPLTYAIERNNIRIVRLFLDSERCDVNTLSVEIINKTKTFPYKTEERLNERESTPLTTAIKVGNAEIVRLLLLRNDIDVNFIVNIYHDKKILTVEPGTIRETYKNSHSEENSTPLHFAVKNGNAKMISYLLQHKNIDVEIKDDTGKKAIDYATNDKIKELFNH
ncbi:hypothetical protein M9Y10_008007 [Tritrichomonas musculus]|uniref:DUF3447 domain-containing protein n=1 Tax=Tritrichomonas musculus TaxID=1915356 RepID=A0ABR2J377_9EUKA